MGKPLVTMNIHEYNDLVELKRKFDTGEITSGTVHILDLSYYNAVTRYSGKDEALQLMDKTIRELGDIIQSMKKENILSESKYMEKINEFNASGQFWHRVKCLLRGYI